MSNPLCLVPYYNTFVVITDETNTSFLCFIALCRTTACSTKPVFLNSHRGMEVTSRENTNYVKDFNALLELSKSLELNKIYSPSLTVKDDDWYISDNCKIKSLLKIADVFPTSEKMFPVGMVINIYFSGSAGRITGKVISVTKENLYMVTLYRGEEKHFMLDHMKISNITPHSKYTIFEHSRNANAIPYESIYITSDVNAASRIVDASGKKYRLVSITGDSDENFSRCIV